MTADRRRYPRAEAPAGQFVRVDLRQRVQLIDISLSGALIACDTPLPVSARGRLRAGFASGLFSAHVQVCRQTPRDAALQKTGLGALFLSMDDGSRRSLEQFLLRASGTA